MADLFLSPGFLMTYALLQGLVFLLLLRFLDIYERESLSLLALLFFWGATGAAVLSLIGNPVVQALLPTDVETVFGAAISAPIVEEVAKGIALLIAFWLSHRVSRRLGVRALEGVTDGLVLGAAVGLGFAFSENFFYFLNFASSDGLSEGLEVFILRTDFLGKGMLGHAIYTGLFGAGLGLATWSRDRISRFGFPVLGLVLGVLAHAAHNGLVQLLLVNRFGFDVVTRLFEDEAVSGISAAELESAIDAAISAQEMVGWIFLLGFLVAGGAWIHYQRRVIVYELSEEAKRGLTDPSEIALISSFWPRKRHYLQLLREGQTDIWLVRLYHSTLIDLAFSKWRMRLTEAADPQLERLRERAALLRTGVYPNALVDNHTL